jgi:hypothetical protein
MAGLKFCLPLSYTPVSHGLSHGLSRSLAISLSIGLSTSTAFSFTPTALAAPAPDSVTTLIRRVDQAANSRQLPALVENFAPSYTVDGMSRTEWQRQISNFWQRYPNLRYRTTLQTWKQEGNALSIETLTEISGSQVQVGKPTSIAAKIQSRQRIVGGKIAQQQILTEQVRSTSGSKPPTVDMVLPDKLRPSEEYNVDVIVQEPLNDDVMMGAINEQAVNSNGYGKPTSYKLELLSTGGLFKTARAPNKVGDYWISAVFVRPDGMTTITRRVHVRR